MLLRIVFCVALGAIVAMAQDSAKPGTIVPQGSSIPGLSGVPGMQGAGYLEIGGSRSDLTAPLASWTDFYVRGSVVHSSKNAFDGELSHQDRYGDSGFYYGLGMTHSFGENFYADVHAGTSSGGFFLPKLRTDGFVNFKLLPRRQFILSAGGGFDKAKTANSAMRAQVAGTYYFEWPWIVQGGVTMTIANPGNVAAPSGYLAITEGRAKEHYITVRAEMGREGYELVGDNAGTAQTLFNFPIHNYSGTWRQWIGTNWGLNFTFERTLNPFYNRNGATLGLFLDF